MAIMHMIHGFVGVGKTTFAKELEQKTGAKRFTPDEHMIEVYGHNPPAEKFAEYQKKIKDEIWQEVRQAVNSGGDVILDFGFWTLEERNQVRDFAAEVGADIQLYELQCSEETSVQRTLERTAELPDGAFFIDQNAIEEFKERFEPIDHEVETSISVSTD